MSVMVGLNMCDWTSSSPPLGLHVPSPFGQCALARKWGPGNLTLPPRGGSRGAFAPPGTQEGLGGRRPPNSIPRQTQNLSFCQVNFVAGCRQRWRWDGSFSLYALLLLFAIVLGNCTGAHTRQRWILMQVALLSLYADLSRKTFLQELSKVKCQATFIPICGPAPSAKCLMCGS